MVNYEALIIDANQKLVMDGKDPLYVVYTDDGMSIADSPLGFISENGEEKRDEKKQEELFQGFLDYLLSDEAQDKIQKTGRRTGFGVEGIKEENKEVFNSEWGIDTERVISTIPMPQEAVLMKSLNLYQTEFKKPGFNVFVLDYSGSMSGDGVEQLNEGLKMFMDQERAAQLLLQTTETEMNRFVLFSSSVEADYETKGPKELQELLPTLMNHYNGGGTALYEAATEALRIVAEADLEGYNPAIILMTDGEANGEMKLKDFLAEYDSVGMDIPVFSILFGSASEKELKQVGEHTHARVFDGRDDLASAFRSVRGYN